MTRKDDATPINYKNFFSSFFPSAAAAAVVEVRIGSNFRFTQTTSIGGSSRNDGRGAEDSRLVVRQDNMQMYFKSNSE